MDGGFISFPKLGITFEHVSRMIKIGNTSIAWYGVIIASGMLLCMLLGSLTCKYKGLSKDSLVDYLLAAIPSAIVGARLYYVAFEWDSYKNDLSSIFNIREGGLAIYGGLIGAFIAVFIMSRFKKDSFLNLLDFAFPLIFLGQAIGRWGNFVNQEAFGGPTDLPWGMTGSRIDKFVVNTLGLESGTLVHPTFLYESVICFIGFLVLMTYSHRFQKGTGETFSLYLFIYGAERMLVEGLRTDSLYIGNLRVSQILSACLLIISIPLFIDCRRRYNAAKVKISGNEPRDESTRTSLSDIADEMKADDEASLSDDSNEKADEQEEVLPDSAEAEAQTADSGNSENDFIDKA